jgi:hypothetical protein
MIVEAATAFYDQGADHNYFLVSLLIVFLYFLLAIIMRHKGISETPVMTELGKGACNLIGLLGNLIRLLYVCK